MSLLALTFLVIRKRRLGGKHAGLTVPEVRAVLTHLLDVRVWDEAAILRWSR